jgi:hypothetical protein
MFGQLLHLTRTHAHKHAHTQTSHKHAHTQTSHMHAHTHTHAYFQCILIILMMIWHNKIIFCF